MTRLSAFGLLALCACATLPARPGGEKAKVLYASPGSPQPEGKLVCSLERPTGSNIAERVCRYQNQNDWNARRVQDLMQELDRRGCNDLKCYQDR
jgi:hypothetical protein